MDDLADHDPRSLAARLRDAGFAPIHARRLLRAYYDAGGRPDFRALERLPRRLVDWLAAHASASAAIDPPLHRGASADGTLKLLLALAAGGAVESVLMPNWRPDRARACVSSQIGCAMGCDFCASTRGGLKRNLSAAEITHQFLHLRREATRLGRRITSLVFMGMGEPMHNLDNVLAAIVRIADPDLGGVGWRQITVSTVGVVPGIDRLADADLNVHLAVSLHAPDDATRGRIIPANRRYPIAEVLAAASRFQARTGRITTIEYCLLAGVNDSDAQARALADLLADYRFHVNLIPYNPAAPGATGIVYRRPTAERVIRFLDLLRQAGTVAHVRETRGDDVDAACGQLRHTRQQSAPLTIAGGPARVGA